VTRFVCPKCGKASSHPTDADEGYCGACREFTGAGHGALHLYVSTYCIHRLHDQCRLTCKTCGAACLCPCHPAPTEGV
jgi:hypothetical protein